MIPTFPEFKNLEWSDKHEVEHFTSPFPPYSDFNFTSMWAWNIHDKMMLSKLNNNLIVLFYDYINDKPFLSFIGKNKLAETVEILLDYSQEKFQHYSLKLIPECVAKQLLQSEFRIKEDEDSHDYIISIDYLKNLLDHPSKSNYGSRDARKFLKNYPNHAIKKQNEKIKQEVYIDMFKKWAKIKNHNHWELNEYKAFERLIENGESTNKIVSIHINDEMIGFNLFEILSSQYAVSHFTKADNNFKGVYDALFHETGKALHNYGIKYINWEQDLGIQGLRWSKKKYHPEFYLKKFILSKI